jgi:hypothetical protein
MPIRADRGRGGGYALDSAMTGSSMSRATGRSGAATSAGTYEPQHVLQMGSGIRRHNRCAGVPGPCWLANDLAQHRSFVRANAAMRVSVSGLAPGL